MGKVVHQKTAAVLAVTSVKGEDQRELARLAEMCKTSYNEASRIPWGDGTPGPKALAKIKKREAAIDKEMSRRMEA